MLKFFLELMERGYLPDFVVRFGIRRLCAERLRTLAAAPPRTEDYARELSTGALAEATREANGQHYEVPTEFFRAVLGEARKYSCAHYSRPAQSLAEAEEEALSLTAEHAKIKDGMRILELGCGWGSLTLYLARRYPLARILAISNSRTQREYIEGRAREEALTNVEVRTLDLSRPDSHEAIGAGEFDRVVSVEMFEHFKNYRQLLALVARWLKPDGKLFVHIFTHRQFSYPFETEGDDNWLGRYFFTGGQMPARELLHEFQNDLSLDHQWDWNGEHYRRTAEDWLRNLDRERDRVLAVFTEAYGAKQAARWLQRWRVFFLSCSELFGFDGGKEWGVSHYLFSRKTAAGGS